MNVREIKKYGKKDCYSYSFGSFPTFELLQSRAEIVEMVLVHSDVKKEIRNKLKQKCESVDVEVIENDRYIEKIRDKDNCIVIGVFRKYHCKLDHDKNHVVLVNPSDAGNLGTIIRSCVGFGIVNLAVIEPAVDLFHPKVVRASMGAIFKMKFEYFPCFGQYEKEYGGEREKYSFMLNGKYQLGSFGHSKHKPYALIFGSEAGGLDESFLHVGKSVVIPHAHSIDSLNLSLAVGIGIYEFSKS